MLLNIMEIISSAGSLESLLTAFIGAVIALLVFAVIQKWHNPDRLRKHRDWSFVQPFEE